MPTLDTQTPERAFNLLDEPWIRVMRPDCTVAEVSLRDALVQAHTFRALAGELPTQDVAMLRLLLAVMHAVFYRVDEEGRDAPITGGREAYARWKALWAGGKLPPEPIDDYLARFHDRFWLFDPEKPFAQAQSASVGTAYSAAKLNGELSESSNKIRLFPLTAGQEKESLTYAQAARWILHIHGYDDTSAKPKGKNLPSPGAGWLGKCGLIAAKGNNLFETIMLNFVLLRDTDQDIWQSVTPIWELDAVRSAERTQIAQPDDQAALLTLQSRRILLLRDGARVCGYALLGGDFFERKDAFSEQMTLWRPIYEKKNLIGYQPCRHDASRQIWRDFSAIAAQGEGKHMPGLVTWHAQLFRNRCLPRGHMIVYGIASVQYGDKDFFVTDVFSDELSFHLSLLDEMNRVWRQMVVDQIAWSDKVADAVGLLAANLDKARGGSSEEPKKQEKTQFYYRIDVPFRRWLHALSPDEGNLDDAVKSWRDQALAIARELGRELVASAGQAAFIGRTVVVKDKIRETKRHYAAPEAFNLFLAQLSKLG